MIMLNQKQIKTFIFGVFTIILGTFLRLSARDIAWPDTYSYSGPRENTSWAIKEQAYQDIGMVFLIFGLAVIIVVIINWLWIPKSLQKD
jgi:hypothetical protein